MYKKIKTLVVSSAPKKRSLAKHHQGLKYTCMLCDQQFTGIGNLARHGRRFHERQFDQQYTYTGNLDQHKRNP